MLHLLKPLAGKLGAVCAELPYLPFRGALGQRAALIALSPAAAGQYFPKFMGHNRQFRPHCENWG